MVIPYDVFRMPVEYIAVVCLLHKIHLEQLTKVLPKVFGEKFTVVLFNGDTPLPHHQLIIFLWIDQCFSVDNGRFWDVWDCGP